MRNLDRYLAAVCCKNCNRASVHSKFTVKNIEYFSKCLFLPDPGYKYLAYLEESFQFLYMNGFVCLNFSPFIVSFSLSH